MSAQQTSKILDSRDKWKSKACSRGYEIREHRKKTKRHIATITELKFQVNRLKGEVSEQKKTDKSA
jgi:hypothetical protein